MSSMVSRSPPDNSKAEEARLILTTLSNAVRQMIPAGTRPIPANPDRFNLLARPWKSTCRACSYPGHHCDNVYKADACRTAILSTIGFWEDIANHISNLYQISDRFREAVAANVATYEMRHDDGPQIGGTMEEVVVNHLTCNYLRFQSHSARIRPKAEVILHDNDKARYEDVSKTLNGFLLNGRTLSQLFEQSLANQQ